MGFETFLVGYSGSKPIPSLLSIPHVNFLYLSAPPAYLALLPFWLSAPRKVIHQVVSILHALLVSIPNPPEFIVVQNPPSIPTLALVWFVAKIRGSKVIIDWHNLGYSILALKLGERHVFVKIAKWFERYFGRSAYAHLFVTHAMREFLVKEWDLKGHKAVLHDRPPAHFHRASPAEIHELFLRLAPALSTPSLTSFLPPFSPPYSTPFTATPTSSTLTSIPQSPTPDLSELSDTDFALGGAAAPTLRADRPALLVSSTSWTPDEDFRMLLAALEMYERRARARSHEQARERRLPKVLMVVTGKGPLRAKYMRRIEKMQRGDAAQEPWRFVRCISMWLEAEDYPRLLGSADLGISLHSSSSALDLPMKIVDMFGCELPVCALGFACLDELVKDGVNGLIFNDAAQLADQLETLLTSYPSSHALATLRASLEQTPAAGTPSDGQRRASGAEHWEWGTWSQNWNSVVRPLVLSDVGGGDEI
ncbi:Chitobiosyldiphosphodolichol beta-mannosyltransferase [Sparassis crispa]|uniref:Chitobiosyldiphosphodolichol beta-mannosyltransferase n=1 Tax=Sparassis crispa TaxID=139825 RepID=A0A401G910_9APHY|nr:Chitobiosyldiphosphodolichol beta-mannosyltransferase [Sparassis crispa]GBE78651.1 Chitobiosyldiphosphodolichol beta-mannosyltransferase [Sparassis crispa]